MNVEELEKIVLAIQPLVENVTDSAVIITVMYIFFKLLIELLLPLVLCWIAYKGMLMIKDVVLAKKVIKKEVSLDKYVISHDDVELKILQAFDMTKEFDPRFGSEYMHRRHADILLKAVEEKLERDRVNNQKE